MRLIGDLLAEVVNINAEITAGSTDDTDVKIDADAPIGIPFLPAIEVPSSINY